MERYNYAAKALRVGLNLEDDLLDFHYQICKYLDAGLSEVSGHVMERLQQNRDKAMAAMDHARKNDLLKDDHFSKKRPGASAL